MKTSIRTFIVIGAAAVASQNVLAQGECDKYRTSYDQTYCFSKLFVESDKELNAVYKDLRAILRESARAQLTEAQRSWIQYRDQACQPKVGTIDVDCNYEVNRLRTEYLRDRLRECKAGTCRDEMIASRAWN